MHVKPLWLAVISYDLLQPKLSYLCDFRCVQDPQASAVSLGRVCKLYRLYIFPAVSGTHPAWVQLASTTSGWSNGVTSSLKSVIFPKYPQGGLCRHAG